MTARVLGLAAIAMLAMGCDAGIAVRESKGAGSSGSSPDNLVSVSPALPAPGVMVTFDSGILGDGDRSWTFGDGGSASGVVVGHTFDAEGVYQITVVRDDGIGSYEHSFTLVVDDPTKQPDVVTAELRPDR